MPDYYDSIYRQTIKKLQNRYVRPYNEKEEKIVDFSCAIMTRVNRDGGTDYDLVEQGDFYCGKIEQRTDLITVQVDVYKLSNSFYLLEQADRLTYQLCSTNLYDY